MKSSGTVEQFTSTSIPSGWNAGVWNPGGVTTYSGGIAAINGANIYTSATFLPGSTLEFSAQFTPGNFENIGFSQSSSFDPFWIAIGRGGIGSAVPDLYIRTSDGVTTSLGTNLINAYHTYRITWGISAFTIFVDGLLAATINKTFTTPLIMIASDYNADATVLSIDWIRNGAAAYPASGVFTSRIFALGSAQASATPKWNTIIPAGTAASIAVRYGNTPNPDASWSALTPVNNNQEFTLNKTYLQYQATLTTTNTPVTPTLNDISFTCTGTTISAPPQNVSFINQQNQILSGQSFSLDQNRPNPYYNTTMISYTIPKQEYVTLIIYDLQGRIVKIIDEGKRNTGKHILTVDSRMMTKGFYFYRLQAGEFSATKKMILE